MANFSIVSSLAIVLLAAFIHASFQLSISVLTLLSGHALGRKTAHLRLMRLVGGFVSGVGIMTILLLSTIAFILDVFVPTQTPLLLWAAFTGAAVGVGLSVWLFYYKREPGTSLWMPRSMARYLSDRSKTTKNPGETFSLGLGSAVSELLFSFAPLIVAALVLIQLPFKWQLIGVGLYAVISLAPLLIVGALIGGGHKLSHIQRWREANKIFLQFASGSALFVLGAYIYVERVLAVAVAAGGQ